MTDNEIVFYSYGHDVDGLPFNHVDTMNEDHAKEMTEDFIERVYAQLDKCGVDWLEFSIVEDYLIINEQYPIEYDENQKYCIRLSELKNEVFIIRYIYKGRGVGWCSTTVTGFDRAINNFVRKLNYLEGNHD